MTDDHEPDNPVDAVLIVLIVIVLMVGFCMAMGLRP